jgi:hypothetical protein
MLLIMLKNFNKNYRNNRNISIFTSISYHSVFTRPPFQHNQQCDTLLPIVPCTHKLNAGIAYREIFPFAWRKKRECLARSSVTQRPNQGSLGVVDVHRKMLSLHVLWVKRLIFRSNLPWTIFFSQYLTRAFPGRSVRQSLILAVPPTYAMDALPPFYRSVMTAWFALERKFVNNEYVICGPRQSVVTLE